MTWSTEFNGWKHQEYRNDIVPFKVNGAPAVVSTKKGRLDVFVLDDKNFLHHRVYENDTWLGNWENISDNNKFSTSPAAVTWGSDRVDLFAVWTNGEVHHRVLNGNSWSPWGENLGGKTKHAPTAVSFHPKSFEVFVRGAENNTSTAESGKNHLSRRVWFSGEEAQRLGKNGDWQKDWEDLDGMGGDIASAPAAVVSAPGTIDFFAVRSDGQPSQLNYQLEHRREVNGNVTAWEKLVNTNISIHNKSTVSHDHDFNEYYEPAVASGVYADGRVDVFVCTSDNKLKKGFIIIQIVLWKAIGLILAVPSIARLPRQHGGSQQNPNSNGSTCLVKERTGHWHTHDGLPRNVIYSN